MEEGGGGGEGEGEVGSERTSIVCPGSSNITIGESGAWAFIKDLRSISLNLLKIGLKILIILGDIPMSSKP